MKLKALTLILILALTIRVVAALYLGNTVSGLSGAHDEISYDALGIRLVEGHGLTFPNAWYPWIKPDSPQSYYSITMSAMLALIYWMFGYQPVIARLIMAVLSTGIVFMLYLLARRLFGEQIALITALIAAVYSYLIFYGVTLVTETPFILSLLASIYLAYKLVEKPSISKWFFLGITLAICVLLRMAVIFYVPFLIGWITLQIKGNRKQALIPIVSIIAALIPFTIRNYILWGRFMLLEAQFGHVFWNGNNPAAKDTLDYSYVYPIPSDILASNNDAKITSDLLILGIKNVLNDPELFIKLTLVRLREFIKFWPTNETSLIGNIARVTSFGIIWPFVILGMWLSRYRWRELMPIYIFMIIHFGVYVISWTMIRYRMPLDAIWIIFAAVSISALFDYIKGLPFLNKPSESTQV
jgi:4-amino-4-deoxy-L-arabinose transferase-like glycosyltransferase